jgi:phosphoribosylformimino-5-aminoimidazole carboxamide ribotide isomerase
MDLVLAMDLKGGVVVHGKRGDRATYRPLTWGISPSADPEEYLMAMQPRFLYIADLDRIAGTGSHDALIASCARMVERCYVDRGCRSADDLLAGAHIVNVVGTETAGDLSLYRGGMLSIDVRDGLVIPGKRKPADVLALAADLPFDCCVVLNISAVGTEEGLSSSVLGDVRRAYRKKLFYGGGIRDTGDLDRLASAGFDGVIVATAVHTKAIPHECIRRGYWCS